MTTKIFLGIILAVSVAAGAHAQSYVDPGPPGGSDTLVTPYGSTDIPNDTQPGDTVIDPGGNPYMIEPGGGALPLGATDPNDTEQSPMGDQGPTQTLGNAPQPEQ